MNKFQMLLVAVTFLLPALASADWKGKLEVEGAGGGAPGHAGPGPGTIYAKGSKLRFEVSAEGRDMIVLTDTKSHTSSMLMPQQKMVMEMPSSMKDKQQLIDCSIDDVEKCLKEKNFKKVGSETVDGHPCAIYEGDENTRRGKSHQKIWRPTDLKEVFMIKSMSTMEGGKVVTTHVKDIQMGKLDNSLFTVPSDYKKMQMPDFGSMQHH